MNTELKKNIAYLTVAIVIFLGTTANASQKINPNDSRIMFGGSLHLIKKNESVLLNRHSEALFGNPETVMNRERANTTSGITISLTTNSKLIKLFFGFRSDVTTQQEPYFAIYKNDEYIACIKTIEPVLENKEGKFVTWKIYLPIFVGLTFYGVEIDDEAQLKTTKTAKCVNYVAIGNSITHGVGQKGVSSDGTYPALLAREKKWSLYNLAVGGSHISPSVADEFDGLKADIITVLWGYNDWKWSKTGISEIADKYRKLLVNLRKKHPESDIYCILPTYTTTPKAVHRDSSVTISLLREAEMEVITSLVKCGDAKLFQIDGLSLTSEEDLIDTVHLSTEGARRFAKKIAETIR